MAAATRGGGIGRLPRQRLERFVASSSKVPQLFDGRNEDGVERKAESVRQSAWLLQSDHRQGLQWMRGKAFDGQLHKTPMKPGTRPRGEHRLEQLT